jgi:hypothetical protein
MSLSVARYSVLLALVIAGACASSPDRRAPTTSGDKSDDAEFSAARETAQREREFDTQAEAIAAGVYEPFVHPDSVIGAPAPPATPELTTPRVAGDPSTEELIGTLDAPATYNPPVGSGQWTLQMGAFNSETGTLVRIRQLEEEFPELPRWFVDGDVYRVYLGRFVDRATAERWRTHVAQRGYPDAWVTHAP